MLVIRRKSRSGEYVQIGPDVRVYVVDVRGDMVGVGIDAPQHIKVGKGDNRITGEAQDTDKVEERHD